MCGIISTRTDAELRDLFSRLDEFDVGFFSNSRAVELVQHLINKGSLQVGRGERFTWTAAPGIGVERKGIKRSGVTRCG